MCSIVFRRDTDKRIRRDVTAENSQKTVPFCNLKPRAHWQHVDFDTSVDEALGIFTYTQTAGVTVTIM